MEYNEIIALISNMGFPITITLYVLIRLEAKMDKLNESINKLSTIIEHERNL